MPYPVRSQTPLNAPDLVSYLAEFGWTLADLEPAQLAMFVAARNAAAYVAELEIPVASQPSDLEGENLAERETQRTLQLTTYQSQDLESRLPSDEMDVASAACTEDLPRIFPTQWLLEETQPELFYRQLATQELLMPIWQRPQRTRQSDAGESPERELVEDAAEADTARQHAHVLLDCSRTMDDRDRRGTIARGLALAVLYGGYQQGARLNLRPFTAKVGQLSSGSGPQGLHTISQRLLALANAGQTRIQGALESAVADVRQGGACQRADIVLITDGISRLQQSPFEDEKLHVLIVGDLFEKRGENRTIATLKSWSTTFQRVWCNRFADLLAPGPRDLAAAQAVLRWVQGEQQLGLAPLDAQQIGRVVANVAALLTAFEQVPERAEPLAAELAVLREELAEAQQLLATCSGPAAEELKSKGEDSRDASLAGRRSRGSLRLPDWAWLRRLLAALWRRLLGRRR